MYNRVNRDEIGPLMAQTIANCLRKYGVCFIAAGPYMLENIELSTRSACRLIAEVESGRVTILEAHWMEPGGMAIVPDIQSLDAMRRAAMRRAAN